MNENEIVKLREMQVDERDVPAKYIEAFNSYLDDVVIPHFEKQLAKKDKEIETLRFTIDEMSNANKNIHKAFEVLDKNLRHQICEEIRQYDMKTNKQKSSYTEYVEGLWKKLKQIEKGDEE